MRKLLLSILGSLTIVYGLYAQETLQSVTDRGASSTNSINIGNGINVTTIGSKFLNFYNAASSPAFIKLYDDINGINGIGLYKSNNHATVYFPNGSVGIGTSTPSESLEVVGKVRISNTQIWDNEINRYNNDNLYIGFRNTANTILQANGGNVGIGTATPAEKLSVNGRIRAKEIKVETANWPDYIFSEDYKSYSLSELENFIKINKHLPEIPSAKEAEAEGINLGEMNAKLLKKIEELTLYLIEKDKELKNANCRIDTLSAKINLLLNK